MLLREDQISLFQDFGCLRSSKKNAESRKKKIVEGLLGRSESARFPVIPYCFFCRFSRCSQINERLEEIRIK